MVSRSHILFSLLISVVCFFSCQRELHFPVLTAGGALTDSSGNCLPKTIAGTFTAGKATADSNFIQVWIQVTQGGDYTVSSDTVNGFSFKGNGNFPDTGLHSIKLVAVGTPTAVGTSIFVLHYNNSQCSIAVSVKPEMPDAVFTLGGAPDTCHPATVSGSYITGVLLNDDDTATVSLEVAVAGIYTISTNTVNGYKFSGSGYVPAGTHTITLKSAGTPVIAGTDYFSITAGGSSCSFAVPVTSPVSVTGNSYFPLTINSYWIYDSELSATDTLKRVITGETTINNVVYTIMHEHNFFGDTTLMFRKTGNDYLQYGPVDILTLAVKYSPAVTGEINFMKQTLSDGDNWTSDEYVGNLQSGQPVYLQYYFSCEQSNTGITVNGYSFANVYHIIMMPEVRSSTQYPYSSTSEVIHLYYAKGVGLVYIKGTNNTGQLSKAFKIKRWMVY